VLFFKSVPSSLDKVDLGLAREGDARRGRAKDEAIGRVKDVDQRAATVPAAGDVERDAARPRADVCQGHDDDGVVGGTRVGQEAGWVVARGGNVPTAASHLAQRLGDAVVAALLALVLRKATRAWIHLGRASKGVDVAADVELLLLGQDETVAQVAAHGVDRLHKLVQWRARVERVPHDLAVLGIGAARKVLLGPVVELVENKKLKN